jgi:UDP-N-acetylglucosamine diphosphorylase/glucosamine-1-phosphate N-acetyltransferase
MMKQVALFEDRMIKKFFPIAMTRHIAHFRWGILTIKEKWEKWGFDVDLVSHREIFNNDESRSSIFVNARWLPSERSLALLESLGKNEGYRLLDVPVCFRSDSINGDGVIWRQLEDDSGWTVLQQLTDLFTKAKDQILQDDHYFSPALPLGVSNHIIGDPQLIKVAPSAKVNGCFLNTLEGPIIIDEDAEIMEGGLIRGPFYLGKGSTLKMGAKIYGPTVIGEQCKIGGEVSNSVVFGFSNKAHDGFIGNAVIGEWCNLGADTNCSNLKNNYSEVKQYSYLEQKEVGTGLTFCGLVMGDHSKCGINTMFNTGTVMGVGANVFGGGFLPKHIPCFYWGSAEQGETYDLKKCLDTIAIVKSRRKLELSDFERQMLTDLHREYAFH